MSEEKAASVGEQTASQENTEGCDTDSSATQQEAEEEPQKQPSHYNYEDLHSRPFITPDSEIPEDLLHLSHSFGYDSGRRGNLQLLDDRTLIFIAGNLLVLLDISTKQQRYLRSCSGGGIGAITSHPSKEYFVVAEKGNQPDIIVYEYPSLRPCFILKGGTEQAYSFVEFNRDGSLLASVGSAPDYMLTLWNWMREEVMLSCKAISQEVYRVTFSPYNSGFLTSAGSGHIKFWKMASTFTGLKLQGLIGHFGKTTTTDIEGYVELPDGKVVSGSDWGNLLLWDGNAIKVEICRKGRNCHHGLVQPFSLEDGQLMTIGADGVVRGWDFESIDSADVSDTSSMFELEPMNEMVVGHNVSLSSVVKSNVPDSFLWFAQDSSGAIWKLDLSFTYTTPDPECLFTFHSGPIQCMDASRKAHLMATTTLDRSVKVFDFLSKTELTTSRFNQGGTALSWAPPLVNQIGGLLVTGFEDGVVRLLELFDPQKLLKDTGRAPKGDAKLRLKQAFKPHNAPVTAVAYERNGEILATGSSDCTVFFFTVGEKYKPIGFVHVPGPVQALEWSPHSHSDNRLLILCLSGHVVEVQSPDPEEQKPTKTFQLPELPSKSFRFRSIKSRIKREEEIARRAAAKEKKQKEREARLKEAKKTGIELEEEEEEEEEEELPSIYIPDPTSPLYCGFYSQPGQFWLSMGGYDAGFLYHCKFSEKQDKDPAKMQDEPFDYVPIHNADNDPIQSITFSSSRQQLLCGMHSGGIRVYPLQPQDHSLSSMQAYWALSVHDNQYGHLRHIRCSHDDLFVLTAAEDGNIFSFSMLPQEQLEKCLQRKKARVPSPRVGLEYEALAQDIEDPAAYSIETAKQKLEKDRLRREAELMIGMKRKKLAELQKNFKQLLSKNHDLPEHVRFKPVELQLDRRFNEQAERLKAQRVREVRKQMSWEEERCSIALSKLQHWFRDSLESVVVTVVAICSEHRVCTYRLPALSQASAQHRHQSRAGWSHADGDTAPERRKSRVEAKDNSMLEEEDVLRPIAPRPGGVKLGDRQVERLRKAAEKADQARAKIEKRKKEWEQLYAEKPNEDCEDPQDVQAISQAKETIGDLKLKSAKDFTVPKHLRMNAESKRDALIGLEENIRAKQTQMNGRIMALRDSKLRLVSQLHAQAEQVKKVQCRLAGHLHRPLPALPSILPEETPEKRLQYSRKTLERYRALRKQRSESMQEGATGLLEQLEIEMAGVEERGDEGTHIEVDTTEEDRDTGEETGQWEEELWMEEEIKLLHQQDSLLEQMETSVCQFDAELLLLRHEKLCVDWQLKLADLRQLTLYQELLLLKEFERREESLHGKLNARIKEENSITSKLEETKEQLEVKREDIARLQDREKALIATFQASLGEENKYEEFLTKVFKKKIKRVKKKEQEGAEEDEEDSDEDSDEDDDWDDDDDDYDSGTEEGGAALDCSVCPPGCEPELFEKTEQLRERRMDLEELLFEEKKSAEAMKKECDTLVKKEKAVKSSRKAAEDDLELVQGEKQQKMNEVDVVVPLRLNQIEYVVSGAVPVDLTPALVLDRKELHRLQERIQQLQVEKSQQRDLYCQARLQHVRLIHDRKDMDVKIQRLDGQCNELMMMRYGRLVDVEALQMLSGNRTLEELKQDKLLREVGYTKEIKHWDVKVEEARQALMDVTKCNTERLLCMASLFDQKNELDHKLNARQKKMGRQFKDYRRHVDQEAIKRLKGVMKQQSAQAEGLRREISLLSRKGGLVLPPGQAMMTAPAPLPTPNSSGAQRSFKYT